MDKSHYVGSTIDAIFSIAVACLTAALGNVDAKTISSFVPETG
jgi:hypothetical protein